jgi:hypothetical protein
MGGGCVAQLGRKHQQLLVAVAWIANDRFLLGCRSRSHAVGYFGAKPRG